MSSGWFRSVNSSHEIAVVTRKVCSNIGSAPLTSIAVIRPLPMAARLWKPTSRQFVSAEGEPVNLDQAEAQREQPRREAHENPARMNCPRRRTCSVTNTATNPLSRLIARKTASTRLHRIEPHRLTKMAA